MTDNDKSNVLVLKDEHVRLQKQAKPKPKTKRGRPPEIDIDAAFNLKAEVTEERRKAGLRKKKDAIANLIGDDAPHSWWWDKDAPVKTDAADKRYHRAVKLLDDYEKKHGQVYEPMSLAKLGEEAGIKPPERSTRTIPQRTEDMLRFKQQLYERNDTPPPSWLVASKRNFRRLEREFVKTLKEYAASISKKVAMDRLKLPPEKVQRDMEHLKALDAHIADFEEKMTKIEREGALILLGEST